MGLLPVLAMQLGMLGAAGGVVAAPVELDVVNFAVTQTDRVNFVVTQRDTVNYES